MARFWDEITLEGGYARSSKRAREIYRQLYAVIPGFLLLPPSRCFILLQ